MPTDIARQIAGNLRRAMAPVIKSFHPLEARIPWPCQKETMWPYADISGMLNTGEVFIVEIYDHADPCRSIIKYWPLLHAIARQGYEYPPICLVEVSHPDSTFGEGFQRLARFIGQQLQEQFPSHFRFGYVELRVDQLQAVSDAILQVLKE